MSRPPRIPDPDELPALYLQLLRRLERIEGLAQQALAERTRDNQLRPTWRDFEELRKELHEHLPPQGSGDA